MKDRSPNTWVLWLHANDAARIEESIRDLADQVKVAGRKDAKANIFKLVQDWLRDGSNGRWLLVLDNADDPTVLFGLPRTTEKIGTDGRTTVFSRNL